MDGQLEFSLQPPRAPALTVSQLVRRARDTLESGLEECWVMGEISNCRLAPSGHLYLTLKDSHSALAVVMFRTAAARLRLKVADGMQVLVRGRISLYEPRGALQFYAEEIEPRGLGKLQLALEQLKQRLLAEGLFDGARKRPLPFLPRTIGLITALRGAAIRDMLAIILSRNPNVRLLIRPARVQGEGAAQDIAQALEDLNRDGRAEVIIVGRGGGSLEDLWAFNEEPVVRAIFASAIPVISAVGHEIDYTLADFVADQRAPTPTAAAQMVTAAKVELQQRLHSSGEMLLSAMRGEVARHRRELVHLARHVRNPGAIVRQQRQRLDEANAELSVALQRHLRARRLALAAMSERLRQPRPAPAQMRERVARLALDLARGLSSYLHRERLRTGHLAGKLSPHQLQARVRGYRQNLEVVRQRLLEAGPRAVARERRQLAQMVGLLNSLSPLRVVERGYAVVTDPRDGKVVTDAARVEAGQEVEIQLWRGRLHALVRRREL
ncbi:MAG TPA: exodeoxyribonuclease VII large subunit [Candidatus Binataceae bacterium]|nr:exodeoxyribonuclease VII large subunit [Candidatus Binataceae bacterium]